MQIVHRYMWAVALMAAALGTLTSAQAEQARPVPTDDWAASHLAGDSAKDSTPRPDAADPSATRPNDAIPFRRFVLDNGLTLIVHEDHKTPMVAVNVWYHVGSKNEKPGKTGFAHLFEHLMFQGSEHFDDDYFKALEKVGATSTNGTTSEDRTNYFENAPSQALDYLLWLESDRMGYLLGAVTQGRLDEQRGVVQNEKRQMENQPYALAQRLIQHHTWPAGHPYSWQVIGSMEDLDAASLGDVKEWFRAYYGTANATLVVAGDVDTNQVLAKVKRYFGAIPSGPPVARPRVWVAKRHGTQRMTAQDRVPQARLYKVWNIPNYGDSEGNDLGLVGGVLSAGKSSRLYKRLVYDEQLATDVNASAELSEIAGQFWITVSAKSGVSLTQVEQALDQELARFLAEGPTAEELQRVKISFEADFVRGQERIGGFGGKSDVLAHNQVFMGDPGYYQRVLQQVRAAGAADLRSAARKWLSDGQFVLEVHPFPIYTTQPSDVDRTYLPVPVLKPESRFPQLQQATLSNGLKVVLAESHQVPIVQFDLLLDTGFAADQSASPGIASLTMEMLEEGTRTRTALQIDDELRTLGARLETSCRLDTASISLNSLSQHADRALEVYADIILHPSFPEANFRRRQAQRLAQIRREKADPRDLAYRVMPSLLYGSGHAYATPLSGSGTEPGIATLRPADVEKFHQTWFKPDHATLVIVGDATLAQITPRLEALFGQWRPGDIPRKNLTAAPTVAARTIYIIDRPGAQQSYIMVGQVAPPKANPQEIAIEMMNVILGGSFCSRINLNLREDKHWSYGARSDVTDARGPRPLLCRTAVQSDKTGQAMQELDRELREITGSKPPTDAELRKAVTDQTLRLTGRWETTGRVASSVAQIVEFSLPSDYFQTYADRVRALDQADLAKAARAVIHPDALTWLIVGDRANIESSLRQLNWGPVQVLDTDGHPE